MSLEEMRRRVHAAADRVEVPPPPADLLSGEVLRGPGRRRTVAVAMVAAAAVLAVVGIGAVVVDRAGRDDQPAAATDPEATAGALLALALEHTGVEPVRFEALTEADRRFGRGTVGGDIRFRTREAYDGDLLRVTATPGRMPSGLCDQGTHCDRWQSEHGEVVLSWQPQLPEEDPGMVTVAVQAEGEWHTAHYSGAAIERDPRRMEGLPVSVDQLVAIVTDPRFGLRTTPEAVEAGRAIDVVGGGTAPGGTDGSLEDWSPRGMAGFVQDELGVVRESRPSTLEEPAGPTGAGQGIHARLSYGTRIDLMLVSAPGASPLACPRTYRCYRGDEGVVYAWKRGGQLGILRDRGDFAVRLWIRDPDLHVTSRRDFLDNVLVRLAELTEHPALAPRMRADYAEVPVPGWTD